MLKATVKRNAWGEYVARLWNGSRCVADYFTDDKADAYDTAVEMLCRGVALSWKASPDATLTRYQVFMPFDEGPGARCIGSVFALSDDDARNELRRISGWQQGWLDAMHVKAWPIA